MAKHPTEQDRLIGRNLRRLRLLAGMSQGVLAEHFGLTFQQVQKYEKGMNRLPGGRLVQACALFKVAPEALLGSNGAQAAATPDVCLELGTTRDGVALARAFNAIADREHRSLLVRLARALARADATAGTDAVPKDGGGDDQTG